jgi:hypothetical protein
MVLAFLIATLVLFSLNLILNLIALGYMLADGNNSRSIQTGVTIFIYLIFITFNIIAMTSL